jgi:hypothetical protein
VRFFAEGSDRTRVELRHLDRHMDGWQAVSEGVDSTEGWSLYPQRYAEVPAT